MSCGVADPFIAADKQQERAHKLADWERREIEAELAVLRERLALGTLLIQTVTQTILEALATLQEDDLGKLQGYPSLPYIQALMKALYPTRPYKVYNDSGIIVYEFTGT